MARAFRATTRGYKAELQPHERRLLSQLCADVITLLSHRSDEVTTGDQGSEAQHQDATDAPPERSQDDPTHTAARDEFAHFRAELAGLGLDTDDDAEAGLQPPEDAVLARLLPDATQDPQESAQFRRLAESSLRESKLADLRAARLALEANLVRLAESQAASFGRALNDVRLTLATRLGIETDADAERIHAGRASPDEDAAANTEQFMAEVYVFATWLQESLFNAMLDVLPPDE